MERVKESAKLGGFELSVINRQDLLVRILKTECFHHPIKIIPIEFIRVSARLELEYLLENLKAGGMKRKYGFNTIIQSAITAKSGQDSYGVS